MSQAIECRATRRGRDWVAHVPAHGVYGHGRSLTAVRDSITAGLAHLGVTAQVTIIPTTPELETLRSAQDTYATALRDAVTALAHSATTLTDIAHATGVPSTRVKALLLPERSALPAGPGTVDDGRRSEHPPGQQD